MQLVFPLCISIGTHISVLFCSLGTIVIVIGQCLAFLFHNFVHVPNFDLFLSTTRKTNAIDSMAYKDYFYMGEKHIHIIQLASGPVMHIIRHGYVQLFCSFLFDGLFLSFYQNGQFRMFFFGVLWQNENAKCYSSKCLYRKKQNLDMKNERIRKFNSKAPYLFSF